MRLIMIDQGVRLALDDLPHFSAVYGALPEERLEVVRDVVQQSLDYQETIDATEPWCGYLCVRPDDGALVGFGGFKGVPDAEGAVEIAYFTLPDFEGLGLGRATAAALCDVAKARGVSTVVAHTLPEKNASTSILERLGFEWAGEVTDPDDGLVWRWERAA